MNKVSPIFEQEGTHKMADMDNGRDSPRDVEAAGEGEVPKARITMTKNGQTEVTLMNKNRQSTKLNLGALDGDLAELLAELDMDGDGQINSAELVRAMQIIKSEREGVQMWRKFAVIMAVVLAVSLAINLCITMYGIYYVVVSNKETKTRTGYLVGAKEEETTADSDDDNTAESRRLRALIQLEKQTGKDLGSEKRVRELKSAQTKKVLMDNFTPEEIEEKLAAKATAVRVKPQGPAVSNWGVEEMFPYMNKDGTVDDDIKSTFALNFKKLSVDTFATGAGGKRSHEVMDVQNTWLFEATNGDAELNVNCFFNANGAYVYYKQFQNGVEGQAGGPIFFKRATRLDLAESQIIHMIAEQARIEADPASFTAITQPAAVAVVGPALANPNNNIYGIQNDWYSAEAFMYSKNRCAVTSAAFKSTCETRSVNLFEPKVLTDSFSFMSKEEKESSVVENAVALANYRQDNINNADKGAAKNTGL